MYAFLFGQLLLHLEQSFLPAALALLLARTMTWVMRVWALRERALTMLVPAVVNLLFIELLFFGQLFPLHPQLQFFPLHPQDLALAAALAAAIAAILAACLALNSLII